MKRIYFFSAACLVAFTPFFAPAQDGTASTASAIASRQEAEENYNTLKGHVDDLIAAQEVQAKQIQAIRKDLEELRIQMTKPSANYASQEDFKQLANAVQEIDKKREADKELILKEMEKLGQTVSAPIAPHTSPRNTTIADPAPPPGPQSDQNGFYYVIQKDDTLSLIAQAYREQKGIKVTTKQIVDANPNINPAKLHVGTKIFIPAPKGAK